jgi:hypothetical protein
MRKRVLIPRKDHEIYIIPVNGKAPPRGKDLDRLVRDTLRVSHPGYSDTTEYDVKRVTAKSKRYLVITVIEKSTLTEYRLLNRHCPFYTATSLILARGESRVPEPFVAADETIGLTGTGEPYSLPADNPGLAKSEEDERVARLMKNAGKHSRVFRKPNPFRICLIPAVPVILVIFSLVYYYGTNKPAPSSSPVEPVPEIPFLPSAFDILADISDRIVNNRATLLHWHYDENADPVIRVSVEGTDAESLLEAISGIPYAVLYTISDIHYVSRKANYELALSLNKEDYAVPLQYIIDNQRLSRALIPALRSGITEEGGTVQSEILPVQANGYASSIVFSGGKDMIAKIFDMFERTLGNGKARVVYMDAYIETGRFNASVTFVQGYDMPDNQMPPGRFGVIAAAFGFDAAAVPEKAGIPVQRQIGREEKKETENGQREGYVKIGVIRDGNGKSFVYYRTAEGRIITESE